MQWTVRSFDDVLIEMLGDINGKGFDWALSLLGMPEDNTVESRACDVANSTGEWPGWGFCRDYWLERVMALHDDDGTGEPDSPKQVLADLRKALRVHRKSPYYPPA